MTADSHPAPLVPRERFTISFAGYDRQWAEWIGDFLSRLGYEVFLQPWDPSASVPLAEAFQDLLFRPGRVLIVLSPWYFRIGVRTDEEWNRALRDVVAVNVHRFAAVNVTDQPLPPATAVFDTVDLSGIGEHEAEARLRRVLTLKPTTGVPAVGNPLLPAPRYPSDPPLVWGGVPRSNTRFTGREEILLDLYEGYRQASPGTAMYTLLGMSGVGKTQIATEYVYRYQSLYDTVWWVPADHRGTLRERLAELAAVLGLPAGTEYGQRIRAVREALRRGSPHPRWLLVFDGADEPEDLADLLPFGPGHILLTSRNREWVARGSRIIDVPVFSRRESVAFVRRRARRLTASEADRLAGALDDIPLLLAQTAGWLDESAMDVDEYVGMLKVGLNTQIGLHVSDDYPMTFQTSWAILLNNLRDSGYEAVVELLRLCAFFAPGPIPLRLLREIPADGLPERLGSLMKDPLRWYDALKKLVQYSVVRLEYQETLADGGGAGADDPGPSVDTVQMHRLVHAVVRNTMPERDKETFSRAVRRVLAAQDPGKPSDSRLWPRYAELIPHLESSGALSSTNPQIQDFVLNCLRYLVVSAEFRTGVSFCEQLERRWTELLDADDDRLGHMRYHHWLALLYLGRYERCLEISSSELARLTDKRGARDLATARAKGGVASALSSLGRYDEARKAREENWRYYREVLGENDARTLSAQNNLSVVLRLQGKYQESYQLDRDTLHRREQVLRPRHAFTLSSGVSCAWVLRLMGRYAEALSRQEQGVRVHLQVLGPNHPQTLRAQHNMALCLRRAGETAQAEELMRYVLGRTTRVLGPTNPDTLLIASDYSVFLRERGDLDQARERTEEVLEQYQKRLGEDHPYTIGVLGNLGLVLRAGGERDTALALSERAYLGMRRRLGDDHPWTIGCALNAAAARNISGQLERAAELSRDALRAGNRVLTAQHPLTLSCQIALAADLRALREHDEAQELEDGALRTLSDSLGDKHLHTISARTRVRPYWEFEPQPV